MIVVIVFIVVIGDPEATRHGAPRRRPQAQSLPRQRQQRLRVGDRRRGVRGLFHSATADALEAVEEVANCRGFPRCQGLVRGIEGQKEPGDAQGARERARGGAGVLQRGEGEDGGGG